MSEVVPSSDTAPEAPAVGGAAATVADTETTTTSVVAVEDEKAAESTYGYCYERTFKFRSKSTTFEVAAKEVVEFMEGVVKAALAVKSGHPLAIAKGATQALGVAKEWVSAFRISKTETIEKVLQASLCKDTYVHLLVNYNCTRIDDSVAFIHEEKGVIKMDGEIIVKHGTNDAAMEEMTELVSKMAREM